MDDLQAVLRLEALTGFTARDALRRAMNTALRGLGARLSTDAAKALARALPPIMATPLKAGADDPAPELDALYDRVSEQSGTRRGVALELTQTVWQVVAELAAPADLEIARNALPETWAALLVPPKPTDLDDHPPPPRDIEPGTGHTLATGRPGSRHPVADSAAIRAQRDSIAASDDPHGDIKLSGTHGISTEREDDTLAAGRPGSKKNPLADTPND